MEEELKLDKELKLGNVEDEVKVETNANREKIPSSEKEDDEEETKEETKTAIIYGELEVHATADLKIVEGTFTRLLDKIQLKRRTYIG